MVHNGYKHVLCKCINNFCVLKPACTDLWRTEWLIYSIFQFISNKWENIVKFKDVLLIFEIYFLTKHVSFRERKHAYFLNTTIYQQYSLI
jgi:hypothetical protein